MNVAYFSIVTPFYLTSFLTPQANLYSFTSWDTFQDRKLHAATQTLFNSQNHLNRYNKLKGRDCIDMLEGIRAFDCLLLLIICFI